MPAEERERRTMPTNRGPAAAAENRAALLASARRLFAERGYHVPLSAIARDAGVGQGSLYRNFPTRLDLALAIFEENFTELEAIAAADDGPGCFQRLWRRLIEFTVESTAFVEMAVDARRQLADYSGASRLVALLEAPLVRAQRAGLVDRELTPAELILLHRMVYGAIITEIRPERARPVAQQALALVGKGLTLE